MRFLGILKKIIAHGCVICSLTMIVVYILDWYNPYMDFAGHATIIQYLLCIFAFLLGISQNQKDIK